MMAQAYSALARKLCPETRAAAHAELDRVLQCLGRVLRITMTCSTFRSRMADLGAVPAPMAHATSEALRAYLKSEIDSWGSLIKQAGISPE
jgi:tripartite-type tricarboxylate transporter receptor subunit TctC